MAQHRRNRADKVHPEIANALRGCGCSVVSLSQVGAGVPDLLCGIEGRTFLVEVKSPPAISHRSARTELTDDQVTFRNSWRGASAFIARDVVDVGRIVAAVVAGARGEANR